MRLAVSVLMRTNLAKYYDVRKRGVVLFAVDTYDWKCVRQVRWTHVFVGSCVSGLYRLGVGGQLAL